MEGIALIEGRALAGIVQRLISIEQNQLAIMNLIQEMPTTRSNVPDFISVQDARKKYHISQATINKKLKLFEAANGRKVGRLQSGTRSLINEIELQEAIRLKTPTPKFSQMKIRKKNQNDFE